MASENHPDFEVEWRSAEDDPPVRGAFVALSRDQKKTLDRLYWRPMNWNLRGLYWRPSPPPALSAPIHHMKQTDEDWLVVLTETQQAMPAVYRIHELGLELYCPIVRERRSLPKKDQFGKKLIVHKPKPMFPGYAFLKKGGASIDDVEKVRGVSRIFREPTTASPYALPHIAVMAIFAKQHELHQAYMQSIGGRVSKFKRGDMVRIDEGSPYSGLIAAVDKIDSKGRIQLLLGMIRHWVPQDMVVAA